MSVVVISCCPQVDPYNKCWTTTFDNKKAIYGKMRVAVSGNDGEADEEASEPDDVCGDSPPVVDKNGVVRTPTDRGGGNIEPVTFNSMSVAFWRDQMKAMKCDAAYDITPLDGCLMLACIELKLFYVGVCFTEHHATELRAWMIKQILKRTSPARSFRVRSSIAHPPDDVPTHKQHTHTHTHTHTHFKANRGMRMETPGSRLYNIDYVTTKEMQNAGEAGNEDQDKDDDKGKNGDKKRKNKDDAKEKIERKKPKKKKKTSSSESGEGSGSSA